MHDGRTMDIQSLKTYLLVASVAFTFYVIGKAVGVQMGTTGDVLDKTENDRMMIVHDR